LFLTSHLNFSLELVVITKTTLFSQSIRPKAPKRVNQCAFSGARRSRLEQQPPSEASASAADAAVASAAAVGAERLAFMACWDPEVTYGDLFLQNGERLPGKK
jgi:hypothetical protein